MVSRDRCRTVRWPRRNGGSAQKVFCRARLHERANLLSRFNKSTRRAKHFWLSEMKVKPAAQKYFCFSEVKINVYEFSSRPIQRGVAQGHRCGAGMRRTRMALLTRAP